MAQIYSAYAPWTWRPSVMQGFDLLPHCAAPLASFSPVLPVNGDANGGYLIRPIGSSPQEEVREVPAKAKGRKNRRTRRGGKPEQREMRLDPSDGKMRTWEGFMMKHAQGACFDEADRLWEAAAPPAPIDTEEEDDGPPPLLEPELPISEKVPKRVRFAITDSSVESLGSSMDRCDWSMSEESLSPVPILK